MAKKMKKLMAMFMVLCMMVSTFGMTAFASDSSADESISGGGNDTLSETVTETIVEGELVTDVTTTTETATDENGNTTVTVTIEKTTEGTDAEGAKVNSEEVTVETTVANSDGEIVGESFASEGSETKEWTEEVESDEEVPEVTVSVIPGESTSATVTGKTEEVTGDEKQNEVDIEYDYTETITTVEREVSVEAGTIDIIEGQSGNATLEGVSPETMEKDGSIIQGYYADGTKKEDVPYRENYFDRFDVISIDPETGERTPVAWIDGADFQYCGWGDYAEGFEVDTKNVRYVTENGEIVKDENGNPILQTESNGWPEEPIQFALQDSEGNIVYAYCVDVDTGAEHGSYYTVSNLEDNTYYASEQSENHIRAIVKNGYWGTSNVPDENGNFQTGSLAKIKKDIGDAFANGTLEDKEIVLNVNGQEETVLLSKLMEDLTEGEALNATQAAIWSWSNGSLDVQNGKPGNIIVGEGGLHGLRSGSDERMDVLYTYLMGLSENEQTESVVIDQNSFIEENSVNLVIGNKIEEKEVSDSEGNTTTNGVYETALNFTLAFVPGEKDDLLVHVMYKDLDGNDVVITKRLSGQNGEGTDYETLIPEADGSYMLKGLKLSENEDFDFDLKLQGTQYLEQGVYVYTAVGGPNASQTMVGLAEGTRSVDVSAKMTLNFTVDEEKNVVAQRVWYDEADPIVIPEEPVEADAGVFALAVHRPLDNIPDEEVPLADAPQTGDEVVFFGILTVLAGISLLAMHVSEKKRKEEV